MTSRYLCKKCMFNTNKFSGIQRHINKKNICKKNLEAFNYSDDQLLILSLMPYDDNSDKIKEEICYLNNSDIINKNKDKLFNDINFIDKNKSKKCTYCNEEFNKIGDLKKHLLLICFYKELQKKNNIENVDKININSKNILNISNNSHNTINNNTTNNITNIYLEIKSPIPFDGEWDISKIDKLNKENLVFSKFMYTKLLEEILKNEINLNVIIDKDNDSGIVYKNDIDKYIKMKSKDIVDNTINKLNKHLLDINNDSKDNIMEEFIDMSKKIIDNKYNSYKNNDDVKKNVTEIISSIFEDKKENALNISNNIQNSSIKNITREGY
jgi:hypothetical protein